MTEGNISNDNHRLSFISRRSIIINATNNNGKYRTTRYTSISVVIVDIGMGTMGRQMSIICQWSTMSESSDDRI
jgi:hypothetical protein